MARKAAARNARRGRTAIPRGEYPRPQFVRGDWLCLNGPWEFEIDPADSGLERGILDRPLRDRIVVPFCPESGLSGIGNTDFLNALWYRREVVIPPKWKGRKILLHFQAVDYDATVWVSAGDGWTEVARHRGGFTPITCDLGGLAKAGEKITIAVRARDDSRRNQPRGKQSDRFENYGCLYTRTTGIWQSVWMEPVSAISMKRPRITPDLARRLFHVEVPLTANAPGLKLKATLSDGGRTICTAATSAELSLAAVVDLQVPTDRCRPWSPDDPHLYDLLLELADAGGRVIDRATSYAGLRSVAIEGQAVKINGKAVFQRLVLDQGFYPDGILTAPTDAALARDIELAQQAGFNGARLHQKVFEERFLYHADRLGYLVWGEFPDWGCSGRGPHWDHQQPGATYITQWLEELQRDYSHPCIIGWCPLNETHQAIGDRQTVLDDVTWGLFQAAKAMDPTRPVLDASGYSHRVGDADVYDSHDYEQDVEKFRARHAGLAEGKPFVNADPDRTYSIAYRGQPYFVSEFGGIWWNPNVRPGEPSWGYGQRPADIEEFYRRFKGLCDTLLQNPRMFGYCYTQLTDVFQEQNGIYTFDRQAKFDLARIRAAQAAVAACERKG